MRRARASARMARSASADTTRPEGVVAHPLFPVCSEWPLARIFWAKTLRSGIAARTVHATHDLRLHRRPRAGDRRVELIKSIGGQVKLGFLKPE